MSAYLLIRSSTPGYKVNMEHRQSEDWNEK